MSKSKLYERCSVHDLIDHISIIVYPGGIKMKLFSLVTLLRMLLTFGSVCCNQEERRGPGLGSGDARESVSHHHQAPQHRRQVSSAVVVMKLLVSENKQVLKT